MSGYLGPYTIGVQPCHDFREMGIGIVVNCPNCPHTIVLCECGREHHFCGWNACVKREPKADPPEINEFVEGLNN